MDILVFSLVNGVIYGLLLFMLTSGLTLIFSMMGVLNFAHASFYMLGAYVGVTLAGVTNFWVALLVAPLLVGAVGAAVERWGLRRVHANGHVAELLFTFGLAYLMEEVVKIVWGRHAIEFNPPAALDFPLFTLFGAQYSAFRIFILVVAVAMLAALWLLLNRSRVGLIIQAALTHPHMVGHLGHDVPRIFMLVFAAGCALAGLAGVIGGSYFVTNPHMAAAMGPIVFVVVVIGGMGSLEGAFVASILIGLVQTLAASLDLRLADLTFGMGAGTELGHLTLAQLAPMLPFLLLVLVLIVKPTGLMGGREH